MSRETFDVVIVGGGIAGAGLATVLARGGLEVCVLERQPAYKDRVRGEWLAPWGVAEAQRAGLYEALLGAGGHTVKRLVPYGDWMEPSVAAALALPLDNTVPGVPGPLCQTHVAATDALAGAALEAGAQVERGVTDVEIELGARPSVAWTVNGERTTAMCRLVVGADGRVSAVRECAGIPVQRAEPRNLVSGLLVDGVDWFPADDEVLGTERDVMYLVFPQGGGRARLYLCIGLDQRQRFAGLGGPAAFLEAFRLDTVPDGERFADATPAGPCATYAGDDTWADEPFADGVLLVGDAAGYTDPTHGQGLSNAMRDVRITSELLLDGGDWAPSLFTPYAEERAERLRRLRVGAEMIGTLYATFGEEGLALRTRAFPRIFGDPVLLPLLLAGFGGPESAPSESFEDGVIERAFAP